MRARYTDDFRYAYSVAPETIQKIVDKQIHLLLNNFRHPSLQSHLWPPHGPGRYQARINKQWRFYYYLDGDIYIIYWLQKHPK